MDVYGKYNYSSWGLQTNLAKYGGRTLYHFTWNTQLRPGSEEEIPKSDVEIRVTAAGSVSVRAPDVSCRVGGRVSGGFHHGEEWLGMGWSWVDHGLIDSYHHGWTVVFTRMNDAISGWWWLEHGLYSIRYWECHHPNWRSHIFQRVGIPPTRRIGQLMYLDGVKLGIWG